MPIPRPRSGEAKDEFISRCMSNATMVDEYGQDQRYAICNQAWENRRSVSSSMKIIPTAHANVKTRMESLDGRPHVVAPMVAMVEGVHCGSKGCDLYLKEELGKFVEAWNGVPIPVMHPQRGDEYISANIPEVLETQVVGRFFNARFEEGKLKGEAWIDIEKAKAIYPDLLTMLNSSAARLEVSTGLWSDDEIVAGEWNGEHYEAIVRNIRPDHIALLPGAEGACSWEDGCGVRANQDKKGGEGMNVDEVVGELENKAGGKGKIREFFGILAKKLGFRAQELSHDEIRSKLQEEVDKLDVPPSESPSILHYVVDVFDDYFVYEKRQSDGDSELYKQEFEVQEDGSVALKGQPEKVMKNVEYVRAQGKVVANFDKKPKTGQGGEQWPRRRRTMRTRRPSPRTSPRTILRLISSRPRATAGTRLPGTPNPRTRSPWTLTSSWRRSRRNSVRFSNRGSRCTGREKNPWSKPSWPTNGTSSLRSTSRSAPSMSLRPSRPSTPERWDQGQRPQE
ncbi:MAG: DUF2213 domain-containing protein [Deltaproteobacteria bacterium]|nr:DUF2213 domain-containing protein [Deltaproteobacteria bacterium]